VGGKGHDRDQMELKAAAAHVSYEWWMLLDSAAVVIAARSDPARMEAAEHNRSIECFLLHFRNLLDFLAPRSPRPNDIVGTDFAAGFQASKVPNQYRAPLDRHLAHLTYSRLEKRTWDIAKMVDELWQVWAEFRSALAASSPARLKWFGDTWRDPREHEPGV
jgi:hypothetical protein